MLLGLLKKIASKKMIARWRDDFELDEWQALFKLTNVVKDFLFKKRIHHLIDLDDDKDYRLGCTSEELYGDRCVEVQQTHTVMKFQTLIRRAPQGGRSMLRLLRRQVREEVKREVGMDTSKQEKALQSIGLHLDPHTFRCLDVALVDTVCDVLHSAG